MPGPCLVPEGADGSCRTHAPPLAGDELRYGGTKVRAGTRVGCWGLRRLGDATGFWDALHRLGSGIQSCRAGDLRARTVSARSQLGGSGGDRAASVGQSQVCTQKMGNAKRNGSTSEKTLPWANPCAYCKQAQAFMPPCSKVMFSPLFTPKAFLYHFLYPPCLGQPLPLQLREPGSRSRPRDPPAPGTGHEKQRQPESRLPGLPEFWHWLAACGLAW